MIDDVCGFMQAARQTTERPNVRQTALYIGLQLEEMAEKLHALLPAADATCSLCEGPILMAWRALQELSGLMKSGKGDEMLQCVDEEDRINMLDADMDLVWVTLGAALSQGNNVPGAWGEVARSNLAKVADPRFDGNGKVIKPEGWTPPDLGPFVWGAQQQ